MRKTARLRNCPHIKMIVEEEKPFKFLSFPGTLMSIASSKIALCCWRFQINHLYPDEIAGFGSPSFMRHMFSCAKILKVPGQIRDRIDRHIRLMAEMLEKWWLCHEQLFDNNYKILSEHLHCFVFDSNGSIDYKATAENILSSDKLSLVEKFKLCCAYCFENDIRQLWPSVSEDDQLKDVTFVKHPTLYYWICVMKNELSEVPSINGQMVEYTVISLGCFSVWPEVEFFWDKLNETLQTSRITFLLSRTTLVKDLLSKLNQSRLDQVLQEGSIPREIIYGLAVHDLNCHYVFEAWNYMKNLINEIQFVGLVYDLFQLAFVEKRFHFEHAAVLLYDVWSTAPDHLKNYVLEYYCDCYFADLCEPDDNRDMRWYGRDMRFHQEILSQAKALSKHRTLWLENWQKVMLIATPADFDKLLKIWADNEEDIESFKHQMMDYAKSCKYFDQFIRTGLTDVLIDYLKYCSSNEDRVRSVMEEIIVSNLSEMHTFERYDDVVKFSNFIDKAFPTPDLAEKFKREKIHDCLENWYKLLDEDCLNGVKNVVKCFFSSDADLLVKIKRKCFEKCKHTLETVSFTDFRIREWNEFLLWCAPSRNEIVKFKKTLPIDDIFDVLLTKAIKGELASFIHPMFSNLFPLFSDAFHSAGILSNLPFLSRFLRWYFGSAEATRTFKLNKIFNYKQLGPLRDILEKGDGLTVERILNWFFVRNEEERKKFEEMLAMERDDDWETIEEETDDDLESEANKDEEIDEEDLEKID